MAPCGTLARAEPGASLSVHSSCRASTAREGPGRAEPNGRARPVVRDDIVLFGNGVFLCTAGVERGARFSSDGITWTEVEIGGWIGFDGAQFVARMESTENVGNMAVARLGFRVSNDARVWSSPVDTQAEFAGTFMIASASDQVLGFGLNCPMFDCFNSNGWLELLGDRGTAPWDLAVTPSPRSERALAIAAGGGVAIVVFSSAVLRTPLPIGSAEWTEVDLAGRGWSIADVAYREGTFVAVGKRGSEVLIATSADGTDWTDISAP